MALIKPEHNSAFDNFARFVATQTGKAWYFTACILMILLWVPTIFILNFNTSQLLINTSTTILTFLLVAIIQNTTNRESRALQTKLDAVLTNQKVLVEVLFQADASQVDRPEELISDELMGIEERADEAIREEQDKIREA